MEAMVQSHAEEAARLREHISLLHGKLEVSG